MSKQAAAEPASWGLRLSALALTVLGVVAVFTLRFSRNAQEVEAIMWAVLPVLVALVACYLLGKVEKLSGSRRRWQIYTYVLVLTVVGLFLKTLVF